jgi:hypothetical protein
VALATGNGPDVPYSQDKGLHGYLMQALVGTIIFWNEAFTGLVVGFGLDSRNAFFGDAGIVEILPSAGRQNDSLEGDYFPTLSQKAR